MREKKIYKNKAFVEEVTYLNRLFSPKLFLFSIFILFIFLIGIPSINADPPFQLQQIEGLDITYPKFEYLQQGHDYIFNFHVINKTGIQTNSTTDCILHIYNNVGVHIFTKKLIWNLNSYNPIDYSLNVTGGNFTRIGGYGYATICNSSNQVGFVSAGFIVTPSGEGGTSNIVFILFLILMLYGINLFGFFGKNETMTLLGGMALIFLGVYLINNGIIIYRDNLTNYFSYITIAWGVVSALMAGYSLYEDM